MSGKRIYLFSLVGFFSIWGLFGFAAIAPRSETFLQATPPSVEITPLASDATQSAGIPITAEPEPVWTEILVFYGLIGITASFLILALLNLANQSTVLHVEHKSSSADKTHQN